MRIIFCLISLALLLACSDPPPSSQGSPTPVSTPTEPAASPTEAEPAAEETPASASPTPEAGPGASVPELTPEMAAKRQEAAQRRLEDAKTDEPKPEPGEDPQEPAPTEKAVEVAAAPPQPAKPAKKRQVELLGVMSGGSTQAMLKIDGKHYTVTRGENAGPYRVASIGQGEVELINNTTGKHRTVALNLAKAAADTEKAMRKVAAKKPRKVRQTATVVSAAPARIDPKTGAKILDNSVLDNEPPQDLGNGWRGFNTGD